MTAAKTKVYAVGIEKEQEGRQTPVRTLLSWKKSIIEVSNTNNLLSTKHLSLKDKEGKKNLLDIVEKMEMRMDEQLKGAEVEHLSVTGRILLRALRR